MAQLPPLQRANATRPVRAPSVIAGAVGVGRVVAAAVGAEVASGRDAWAVGFRVGPGLPPKASTPIRAMATTTAAAPSPIATGEILRATGAGGGGGGGGAAGLSSLAHFRQYVRVASLIVPQTLQTMVGLPE